MTDSWRIEGATKDRQSTTADWRPANQTLIDGVAVKDIRNVVKEGGILCEAYRRDWTLDEAGVDQIFVVRLRGRGVSAWHAHERTTDRLFVTDGLARVVLYDQRPGSPTRGLLNEFRIGSVRPALVVIPPKVWHGIQNLSDEPCSVLNIVDRAYEYEDPDHWRVSPDSSAIPYRFDIEDALT